MICIEFKKSFQKQLQKIPKLDQAYIIQKLDAFEKDKENLDIKKLEPKKYDYYRLRVGKYRLIYKNASGSKIVFFKIDKRDRVYFNL